MKTVRIHDMIRLVNERNQLSTCPPDVRSGWNSLLETMLHEARVYAGFAYLSSSEVPPGCKPGIIRNPDKPEGPHTFPDESRRFYYFHHTVCER